MLNDRLNTASDMRKMAIEAKATGMFLNDDGSTLYLINGQQVGHAEFDRLSGLKHLSTIGFVSEEDKFRSLQLRNRNFPVNPVVWNAKMPKRWTMLRSPLKAYVIAMAVRIALRMGYIVVIIGRCGSGKTMILERALPHRVLNRKQDVIASYESQRQRLRLGKLNIPSGHFALDEFAHLDERTLLHELGGLGNRAFAIAVQSRTDLNKIGIAHWFEARKRLEIRISQE